MPLLANETFRQIFQNSVEAILMVDQDGIILMANPVSEEMFGYEKDGLHGVIVEDLLPNNLRRAHVEYRQTFGQHPEPRPMGKGRDLLAKRRDGSEFPVAISLSYIHSDGQLVVIAFISDISARKKAEEA